MNIEQKYHVWNYVFTVFFAVILVGFLYISRNSIQASMPSVLIIILMALSTQRLTHFITKEKIIKSLRDYIKAKSQSNSFMYTLHELIICPWCTSMWVALFVIIVYYVFPIISIPFFILLSISGVASIIQALLSKI